MSALATRFKSDGQSPRRGAWLPCRNPHCTQAAKQCRLWPCPRTAHFKDGGGRTFRFTSVAGRRQHSIILKPATLFCRCNQLRTYRSTSHLPFNFALTVRGRAAANDLRCASTGGFPMFRTLMIGAVSALTLSAAAFAQRRFGLIIAGAALASIFAGLPISTVEAQSGVVGHGQKPGKRIPFKAEREPPQLTPEQKRLQEDFKARKRLGPPLPAAEAPASQAPAAAPTASQTEVMGIGTTTFTIFLSTAQPPYGFLSTAVVAEPQAATNGPIVFYSANWFASFSTDSGTTFTFVDPYTQFGPLDGGFCCDQTVIYDPTRDLMIWQLQYEFSLSTGKGSYRTAFANPASVESQGWCVYEWNPGDFGLGSGLWLDYPHVALSSNFVWYAANIFTGGNDPRFQQTVIWRIRLDPAATCDSKTFDYFRDTQFNFTQVEGATDTMYWASHITNASMRIYQWAEAGSTPSSTDVAVSQWPLGGPLMCPGPDGLNWCGRTDGKNSYR